MLVSAILFDTRSIQRYIFSGTKLRTNIGASYLVDTVYDQVLFPVLYDKFGSSNVDTESSRQGKMLGDLSENIQCAVGSNGGGSILLLIKNPIEQDDLKDIVAGFSRKLLVKRPGLHIGAAFDREINLDDGTKFKDDLDRLYKKLKENQMTVFPEVSIPYTGLTLRCPVNNETANYWQEKGDEKRFISQETAIKDICSIKYTEKLKKLYTTISQKYDFPMQLEKLGQRRSEDYIAIVHIDGNNMGVKFRSCENQQSRSRLSEEIRRKTEGCFGRLLNSIDAEYDTYRQYLDVGEEYADDGGKPFLPIRPIILGGDDVTFVCPAKLAIRYTKRFIEYMMAEDSVDNLTSSWAKKVDCCAGIAILKTSYPFFSGYKLAESLCDEAKKRMRGALRQKNEAVYDESGLMDKPEVGTSWLDFAILHGEQAPALAQIREQEYRGARGNMHFGPYQVGHDMGAILKERRYDIENLIDAVHQLQSGKYMAKNKIKRLRSVLEHGKHEAQEFMQQLEQQKPVQKLPDIAEWAVFTEPENAMWSKENPSKTPYVDVIEMMDFIPEEADR